MGLGCSRLPISARMHAGLAPAASRNAAVFLTGLASGEPDEGISG